MNLLGRVVHPPNVEGFTTREVHPKEKYIAVDDAGFLQTSPETSGWDTTEGVYKVAMYVWDTDTLTWVRATQAAGGGGGGTGTTTKTKLFDQASSTTLYIGEADPSTSPSSPSWKIKRITFDGSGFPSSTTWAGSGSSTQIWDNRASLGYA